MTSPLVIETLPNNLRRPILIMAFEGWNDAAGASTTAARFLIGAWSAEKFARIDPEEFYHFGLARPQVRFKAGSETEREILWPATEFSIIQEPELARDVIVGVAIEPHLKWQTYCAMVLELASTCQVSLVLTLGALLAEVPHTKPVRLVGAATDPELARRPGIPPPPHPGPTGVVGLLDARVDLTDLEEATKQFEKNLAEIVSQNAKVAAYVKKLEAKAAEEGEPEPVPPAEELPPASDLVAEIEQFLRHQPPHEPKNQQ